MSFLVQFSPISYTLILEMFFFPKQALKWYSNITIKNEYWNQLEGLFQCCHSACRSYTILLHMEEYRYTKAEKMSESAV